MDADWLTLENFAREVGVSVQTVYNWRAQGHSPRAHKIGRRLLFRRQDIETWYETRAEPREETAARPV